MSKTFQKEIEMKSISKQDALDLIRQQIDAIEQADIVDNSLIFTKEIDVYELPDTDENGFIRRKSGKGRKITIEWILK